MVGGLKRPQNLVRGVCVDWFDFYSDFKIATLLSEVPGLGIFFSKIDFFLCHRVVGGLKRPQNLVRGPYVDWFDFYSDFKKSLYEHLANF